jgi:hypothetical protein
MKKRILFLALVFSGACAFAQSLHWVKGMGSSGTDFGVSVATDAAGNVYNTGYFEGTVDFDPGPGTFNLTSNGSSDIYVSKLDANGNFLWAVSFGGSNTDYGYSLDVAASGNVLVTGIFMNTVDFDPGAGTNNLSSAGGNDCFILCLDASGSFVWARRFGSASLDQGHSIAVDAQGNVYTTGLFDATVDFDPGPGTYNMTAVSWNIFVSKLDNSGNFVWAANMGGNGIEYPFSIMLDQSGNIYTSGYFMGGGADFDPGPGTFTLSSGAPFTSNGFVSKLDASGNFVWAQGYLGTGVCQVCAVGIDAMGDLVLTGNYNGTIDFDPGAGTANSTSLNSTNDSFVIKMDPAGSIYWTRFFGGALGDDLAYHTLVFGTGSVFVAGRYTGLADFDPGPAVFNMAPNGNEDIFLLELNAAGNFVNALSAGNTGFDGGSNMAMDGTGNIFLTGGITGSVNFGPGFTLNAAGNTDVFILKFHACTSLILSQPPSSTVQTGFSAQCVIATAAGPGATFQWEADTGQGFSAISNGSLYAGVTTKTLTITTLAQSQNGNAFRCIVTDGSCLVTSSAATLSVYQDTGMDELQTPGHVAVYPNPAGDRVRVLTPSGLAGQFYTICDPTGRQVLSGMLSETSGGVAIGHLASGLYLLCVGDSAPVKIIKQ